MTPAERLKRYAWQSTLVGAAELRASQAVTAEPQEQRRRFVELLRTRVDLERIGVRVRESVLTLR